MKSLLTLFLLAILIGGPTSISRANTEPQTEPSAPKTANNNGTQVVEPAFPGVSEVVSRLTTLNTDQLNSRAQLQELTNDGKRQAAIDKLLERQKTISERLQELGDPTGWSFERLLEIKGILTNHNAGFDEVSSRISIQLGTIEQLQSQWQQRRTFWINWGQFFTDQQVDYPKNDFTASVTQIDDLLKQCNAVSSQLIGLQQQLRTVQETNMNTGRQIDAALKTLRSQVFKKTARSLFSRAFYQQFDQELLEQFNSHLKLVEWKNKRYLSDHWWILALQLSVAGMMAITLRRRRSEKNESSRWNVLFHHPVASGLFIAFATLSLLYPAPPLSWTFFILLISVVSASILITELVPERRHALLVWLLCAIYLTSMLLQVIGLPLPLYRLYLITLSVTGIPLLAWLCAIDRQKKDRWQLIYGLRCGMVLLLVSLVAQLGGYSSLSFRLVDASIKTVFLVLMVLMVIRLTQGAIEYLVSLSVVNNLKFFKLFGSNLAERLNNLSRAALILYGLLYLLQIWGKSEGISSTWNSLKAIGLSVGAFQLTIGSVGLVIVILYIAYSLSWLMRSLFDVEIIGPAYLERGVRDSIKTLLHYFIMTCGAMFALGALGVEMQNFAVVAGALGIGIGFGLQNIVNNFLSGLILLFERPVKLGDRIILDGEWVIVRKIGLRSTVVETYNNAEIIVPNSQLISEKVTNLTLSNAQARIVIDVGTAYGSDIEKILQILEQEAENHRTVLSYPKPSALFTGFGNSSLDFKLRVWLANFDQGLEVRSQLSTAIYKRFAAEGIEIPFPQRDLHLRSVSPPVWQQFAATYPTPKPSEPTFTVEDNDNHHPDQQHGS